MRKYLVYILAICFLLFGYVENGFAAGEPIHVKIGPNRSSVTLASPTGIYKNGQYLGNTTTVTGNNVSGSDKFSSPAGYVTVQGKDYRGCVRFISNGSSLATVNIVDVEDYVKGILPKEIGASTTMEALKVQAVISRSFAYANWNKFEKQGYNLDDTSASQAYAGMSVETDNTNKAVDDTRGEVLYYGSDVANTIFHATSGGVTESIEDVWGGNGVPYLRSMADPYSIKTNHSEWSAIYKKAELNRIFPEVGDVCGIRVLERSSSGRIKRLAVEGSRGTKEMTGNQFRMRMGSIKLKSTQFQTNPLETEAQVTAVTAITANGTAPVTQKHAITSDGLVAIDVQNILTADGIQSIETQGQSMDSYMAISGDTTFYGRGYGHGVGLSQYGAINMAENGMGYRDILAYYYPGTHIQ